MYEVGGKVLFSQVSVCSHFGEVPHPADRGGYPHPRCPGGGVPHPGPGGGVPHPSSRRGTSCSSWGYPLPGPDLGLGTPPYRTGWGTHCARLDGVPPHRPRLMGYPPCQETEQHSEHLLRGGRYASCVHAGGLSCLILFYSTKPKDQIDLMYLFVDQPFTVCRK